MRKKRNIFGLILVLVLSVGLWLREETNLLDWIGQEIPAITTGTEETGADPSESNGNNNFYGIFDASEVLIFVTKSKMHGSHLVKYSFFIIGYI